MALTDLPARLWKRLMLRGSGFAGAYGKLRLLYAVEDPWEMASEREQHRFAATNAQLSDLVGRVGDILEIGAGEGHQSLFLSDLAGRLWGIDISETALARARARCPEARFERAGLEDVATIFPGRRFDLITACEVLYYAADPEAVVPQLQARTKRLYTSNYGARADRLRPLFQGPGWRRLADISHGETLWECFFWEDPGDAG